ANRQIANGFFVEILCRPIKTIADKFRELQIPIHLLSLNGLSDIRSAWYIAKLLKKQKKCIIHVHNFKDAFTAAFARKFAGRKDVHIVLSRHITRKGKNTILYRWLYRQLDWLSFDSQVSRDEFYSTQPSMPQKKTGIIRTSIVLPTKIERANVRQLFNIDENKVIGMYHGRLHPEKGLDILIKAVSLLRDKSLCVLIVGSGSEEYTTHLQDLIEELCLDEMIVLAGFRHPVFPFLADADFGILPSIVKEGCPLSPQEYMSQGLPVVVTNNGGQREYIEDRINGLLVAPGDIQALAEAIGFMVDDVEFRQQLGRQAKIDFSEKLSYDFLYNQITRLYGQLGI
ncbi:MAG: glycosyltransferase, partial [Prevotellaceae bacterium]|nr:glycosyltransferase [Prevotellaceae bacterium]